MSYPTYERTPFCPSMSLTAVSAATTPSRPFPGAAIDVEPPSRSPQIPCPGRASSTVSDQGYQVGYARFPGHIQLSEWEFTSMSDTVHRVALIPGDGTGPDVSEATRRVLDATKVQFDWDIQNAGVDVMDEFGTPLPDH